MALLIDGYNLLYATGILSPGASHGPGVLEKARLALFNVLVESLDPADLPRATIVFDAKDAPPGLPHSFDHRGLSIRFAAEHGEADELIEELIRTDSAPRHLTVVSSDHRLQTAARRRKAVAVDAEPWFDALLEARRRRKRGLPQPAEDRDNRQTESDPESWLEQFAQGVLDEAARLADQMNEDRPLPRPQPPRIRRGGKRNR